MLIMLSGFSYKEIRSCARLLRVAGKVGLSAEHIIEYADTLSAIGRNTIVQRRNIKRKRTPEEKAARKKMLSESNYGRVKVKP